MANDVGAAGALNPQVDITVAVYVAGGSRLDVKVGGPGVSGLRPQLVLATDGVRQRFGWPEASVLITQEQLRRIAVSASVFLHEDVPVEDREVRLAVAVEIVHDHDRAAHVDRAFDQFRRGWNRTLKEQAVYGRVFRNLADVRAAVAEFVERYNRCWRLEKLAYRTPLEAREEYELRQAA